MLGRCLGCGAVYEVGRLCYAKMYVVGRYMQWEGFVVRKLCSAKVYMCSVNVLCSGKVCYTFREGCAVGRFCKGKV